MNPGEEDLIASLLPSAEKNALHDGAGIAPTLPRPAVPMLIAPREFFRPCKALFTMTTIGRYFLLALFRKKFFRMPQKSGLS